MCQFQVYSKVIQLYIYMYLFFFKFFFHLGCYIISRKIPCAIQQVLFGYIILFKLFFTFLFYIAVQPINNVVIVPGRQQRDSAIHTHVSISPQTPLPSVLPDNIEQSSLCYTVSPFWLSVLNTVMCTSPSQIPNLSLSPAFLLVTISSFSKSVDLFYKYVNLYHFLDPHICDIM